MEISVAYRESVPVIALQGRFDGVAASEFDTILSDISERHQTIILDFSRVAYLSSTGIRSLLKLKQQLHARSGETLLVGLSSFVQQVLRTSGLLAHFPCAETIEEALQSQHQITRSNVNGREYSIFHLEKGKAQIESWQSNEQSPVAISLRDLGFAFGIAGFGNSAAEASESSGLFLSALNFAGVHPPEGISDFIVADDPAEIFVYVKSGISIRGLPHARLEIQSEKSFTISELMKDINDLDDHSLVRAFIVIGQNEKMSGVFAIGMSPKDVHAVRLAEMPKDFSEPQECARKIATLMNLQEVSRLSEEMELRHATVWIYAADKIVSGNERLTKIETIDGSSIEEEWNQIIRRIYNDCSRIELSPLPGGFMSKTFRVISYDRDGRKQFPTVLKLGSAAIMKREENACRNYAEKFILNNSTTIMGTASHGNWAGLRYNFVGIDGADTRLTWFREHYNKRPLKELIPLYEKIFWKILNLWYSQSKEDSLYLYKDHTPLRLFPRIFNDTQEQFGVSADSEVLDVPELNRKLANPLHFLKYEYPRRAQESQRWYSAVCHGDLNLQNVLLDEQENIYIIDFSETRVRNALADFARQETIVKFEMTRIETEDDLKKVLEFETGIASVSSLSDIPPMTYSGDDPAVAKAHGVISLMRNYSQRAVHSQIDITPYWLAVLEWTYSVLSYAGFPVIRKKYALYSAAIIVNRILELQNDRSR